MGFIDKFEKQLERKVNSLFSKTFKSGLEPVEIAAAIKHEMDSRASIVSRERILVPNSYQVLLSPDDFDRLSGLGEPLIDELKELAREHAQKQGFQFGAILEVNLQRDPSLALGQCDVSSSGKSIEVSWIPVLEAGGVTHEIQKSRTTVGRDASADIQIGDNGLSRKHFEILWDGSKAAVRDLKSTNGTRINGRSVESSPLASGTSIYAGRTQFTFKVVARAK